MKQICGMCTYYKGYCTNNQELCVNGSSFIDKRETITANVAIDNETNNLHIIVEGDMIRDYETFGKHLFDVVQGEIKKYMRGELQ